MKRNCASSLHIFDLDHTLLKGNSCYHFGVYLFQRGDLPFIQSLSLLWRYWRTSRGQLSLADLHEHVFNQFFLGKQRFAFMQRACALIAKKGDQLFYPPALSRLKEAQDRGDAIAICSSAPDFLVASFSAYLGVNEYCGSKYLVDKRGGFCLISSPIQGKEKVKYMQTLQEKYFFKKDQVTAYSDSLRDLPFLQAAGVAVGVRPDSVLLKVCREKRWEIL